MNENCVLYSQIRFSVTLARPFFNYILDMMQSLVR